MSYKSKVKSVIKSYLAAVDSKDAEAAALLNKATSLLDKGVSKGIYHHNTASRTISRLTRRLPQA